MDPPLPCPSPQASCMRTAHTGLQEGPHGKVTVAGLSQFVDIPWPGAGAHPALCFCWASSLSVLTEMQPFTQVLPEPSPFTEGPASLCHVLIHTAARHARRCAAAAEGPPLDAVLEPHFHGLIVFCYIT